MSIQVRLTTGVANIHDAGLRIVVDDGTQGYLYVLGEDDLEVAIYAPNTWLFAERVNGAGPVEVGHGEGA